MTTKIVHSSAEAIRSALARRTAPAFNPALARHTWNDDFRGAFKRDFGSLTPDEHDLAGHMRDAGCTVTQAMAVLRAFRLDDAN
jgi:hypothetical protein